MEVLLLFWAAGGRKNPKSVPGGTVEGFDAPPARPKRNLKGRVSRGRGVRRSSLAPLSFAAATIRCGKTLSVCEYRP
jgi:hypothetical protein